MSVVSNIQGDQNVSGIVYCSQVQVGQACIGNAALLGSTSSPIDGGKVAAEFTLSTQYTVPGTTIATGTFDFYSARQAGTVLGVWCYINGTIGVWGSGMTSSVDLQTAADGSNSFSTILSSVISLVTSGSAVALFTDTRAVIATAAYSQYTKFRWVVTQTVGAGTLPKGLVVGVQIKENPT
jgi:hypothetical protein